MKERIFKMTKYGENYKMTQEELEKHYYVIVTITYKGRKYAIYGSKLCGDDYQYIFVCITDNWYTYAF